jgi:hypothetical protein
MTISFSPQSVKLLLARGKAATDVDGLADVILKVPGTFNWPATDGRAIEGGFGCFVNQEEGDYITIELRDDDNLLGLGAGYVVDTFDDTGVPTANQGWYFLGSNPLDLHPVIHDDTSDLPAGMYLHMMGHKADSATSDTLYINLHWGKRIR